jgi:hypothetical protein
LPPAGSCVYIFSRSGTNSVGRGVVVEHPSDKFGRYKLKTKSDTRVVIELLGITAPMANLIFPVDDKVVLQDIGLRQKTIWPLKLIRLRPVESLKGEEVDFTKKSAKDFTTPNPKFFILLWIKTGSTSCSMSIQ